MEYLTEIDAGRFAHRRAALIMARVKPNVDDLVGF
jgi:hypothetical protein